MQGMIIVSIIFTFLSQTSEIVLHISRRETGNGKFVDGKFPAGKRYRENGKNFIPHIIDKLVQERLFYRNSNIEMQKLQ